MKLKQTRLVTEDVERLAEFYEAVTGAGRNISDPAYIEMGQPCEGLAIVDAGVESVYGPGVVAPGMNRTAILDFQVENVDTEFGRMKDIVKDWVFEPKDQPWGNRAMLFRDPDGNLINVYMTSAAAAPAPALASTRRGKAT